MSEHTHTHAPGDLIPATFKTTGFEITLHVPSSIEIYDKLAKKTGQCLQDAILNTVYRGSLAEFRGNFCEAVEKETQIARKTKPTGKKDSEGADIEVYDETEGEYFNRVLAESGKTREHFTPLANTIASAIVFDPSATERKAPGPKKVAKAYIAAAQTLIDKGAAHAAAAKLSSLLGREVLPTLESLSGAISEDQRKKDVANEYSS
jgi:hypothetical protein